MKSMCATLVGEASTRTLGRAIGELCGDGDVVALVGPLGAGKTTWTQGFVRGLDVHESIPVRSPTFTLCNEYPGRHVVLHFDLYRLGSADEADGVGMRERIGQSGVSVIEWADLFPELIPSHALWIQLEHQEGARRVSLWEGPGGDVSWARELPSSSVEGIADWSEVDQTGPWERSS